MNHFRFRFEQWRLKSVVLCQSLLMVKLSPVLMARKIGTNEFGIQTIQIDNPTLFGLIDVPLTISWNAISGESVLIDDISFSDGVLLGDVNGDGAVDLLDVAPFVEAITNGQFVPAADINGDGLVNLLDVAPFVELLVGN